MGAVGVIAHREKVQWLQEFGSRIQI